MPPQRISEFEDNLSLTWVLHKMMQKNNSIKKKRTFKIIIILEVAKKGTRKPIKTPKYVIHKYGKYC